MLRRLLKPSLSDFIFLAILGWMFVLSPIGFGTLLEDGDTGWHIRTGEYILDHGVVPQHDLFSFSQNPYTGSASDSVQVITPCCPAISINAALEYPAARAA